MFGVRRAAYRGRAAALRPVFINDHTQRDPTAKLRILFSKEPLNKSLGASRRQIFRLAKSLASLGCSLDAPAGAIRLAKSRCCASVARWMRLRAQSACLCPKILKYCKILSGFAALEFWHPPCGDTKYSVPAEGGMPAVILAGKLTTPQALSAIFGL